MIIDAVVNVFRNQVTPKAALTSGWIDRDYYSRSGSVSVGGKTVSAETAKRVATAYRCANIISDDIGIMPLQHFRKSGKSKTQIPPNSLIRNIAYLLEVSPNSWNQTPFIFKKTVIQWLLFWGNAYIWSPPGGFHELRILPSDLTTLIMDEDGQLWYQVYFPNGDVDYLPDNEVLHLMINSIDGLTGRSVLTYAKDTIGGQLGAHETRDKLAGQGLNPAAVMTVNGTMNDPAAREKTRRAYLDNIKSGVVVIDDTIKSLEGVTMKATDAQFLENIAATDVDIANFFGIPLYKLNQGKQSYESNDQQDNDYLKSTLNSYLIQWEQAGRLKWLTLEEQNTDYLKFNREALLQMDAKARATYYKDQILSGQRSPNETRDIDDMSPYEGGDGHYIPANMATVNTDGSLASTTGITKQSDPQQQ